MVDACITFSILLYIDWLCMNVITHAQCPIVLGCSSWLTLYWLVNHLLITREVVLLFESVSGLR